MKLSKLFYSLSVICFVGVGILEGVAFFSNNSPNLESQGYSNASKSTPMEKPEQLSKNETPVPTSNPVSNHKSETLPSVVAEVTGNTTSSESSPLKSTSDSSPKTTTQPSKEAEEKPVPKVPQNNITTTKEPGPSKSTQVADEQHVQKEEPNTQKKEGISAPIIAKWDTYKKEILGQLNPIQNEDDPSKLYSNVKTFTDSWTSKLTKLSSEIDTTRSGLSPSDSDNRKLFYLIGPRNTVAQAITGISNKNSMLKFSIDNKHPALNRDKESVKEALKALNDIISD